MTKRRVAVLGVHGGRVPAGAEGLLHRAALVAGGREQLDALAPPGAARVAFGADLGPALDAVAAADGPACVLASGDPGFFGIVRRLAERLGRERLDVRPAPSSVAVAFARLGVPWDDAVVVSAHGRTPHAALHAALRYPKVAVLTSPGTPPGAYADALRGSGRLLAVAERLGTPDERVVCGTPEELAGRTFAEPNTLVVVDPEALAGPRATAWPPRTPAAWALPEDAFEHRAGMVTKREVRAVVLSRLGPGTGDLVWDVGCHSGSVAIECARLGAAAIAIDRDPEAVVLCARNAAAHDVPVRVVQGSAPEALAALPDPDAVFVGGGGPELGAILDASAPRTRRAVVVTLAIVERAGPAIDRLAAHGLEVDATMVQASRLKPLAGGHRLAAENPVVVVSGVRP
ncbi:MAG: precorrin-6B C5,15-methyltransferase / cobalt-precorrin-6B C5,C15-methyltransferase [Solirubrobacteraceae bacterium]|nr:precorrin-6B C5,15-methyltransferase / cobalt-precorrin-6B C5,C15-methyltransferase [Solirubrobacteraceae bacterium]